ncbi:hypothetical protein PG994_010700 [Apiospora phragmitis]|uniref:Uncharacterized protein n=1 Tax=Apiospora phragmitis TaxID=2905665 RepID=A0ABR1TQP6_9PEZI
MAPQGFSATSAKVFTPKALTTKLFTPTKIFTPMGGAVTSKKLAAPLAAFTMACVLLGWTRSSIREARRHAQIERQMNRERSLAVVAKHIK